MSKVKQLIISLNETLNTNHSKANLNDLLISENLIKLNKLDPSIKEFLFSAFNDVFIKRLYDKGLILDFLYDKKGRKSVKFNSTILDALSLNYLVKYVKNGSKDEVKDIRRQIFSILDAFEDEGLRYDSRPKEQLRNQAERDLIAFGEARMYKIPIADHFIKIRVIVTRYPWVRGRVYEYSNTNQLPIYQLSYFIIFSHTDNKIQLNELD